MDVVCDCVCEGSAGCVVYTVHSTYVVYIGLENAKSAGSAGPPARAGPLKLGHPPAAAPRGPRVVPGSGGGSGGCPPPTPPRPGRPGRPGRASEPSRSGRPSQGG
eukprot:gene12488-biopygen21481